MTKWFVYIVQGSDDSLYTGITIDIKRRLAQHNTNNKLGAKSLRGKRPVKMVYYESHKSQSSARKRESVIKSWTRDDKLKLINSKQDLSI